MPKAVLIAVLAVSTLVPALTRAQARGAARVALPGKPASLASALENLEWRNIGPANMGGRVGDVEGVPGNPDVYVGTGEANVRNRVSFGRGVYKSTDGGTTWKHLDAGRTWKKLEKGLPKLLGRIAVKVAPRNPLVVYVLAESKEGTLFRSPDRGESFAEMSKEPNIVNRGFYYTDLRPLRHRRRALQGSEPARRRPRHLPPQGEAGERRAARPRSAG